MTAVLKIIEGKHVGHYTKLWDFAEEVKKKNPWSTLKIKLNKGRFQRMFVFCYMEGRIQGWV